MLLYADDTVILFSDTSVSTVEEALHHWHT